MSTKSRIGQNILPDRIEDKNNFNARIIRNNMFTRPIDKGLAAYGQESSQSLGVEQELRRFAMNEYLRTRDDQALVGATIDAVEEEVIDDDLLLTNAITENTVQDTIDKTRYLKETVSYVTVNSAARLQAIEMRRDPTKGNITLTSTGDTFFEDADLAPFPVSSSNEVNNQVSRSKRVNIVSSDGSQNKAFGFTLDFTADRPPTNVITQTTPFDLGIEPTPNRVIINTNNNRVNFRLRNARFDPPDLTPGNAIGSSDPVFDFFLPVGLYTAEEFQTLLQKALDQQIAGVFNVEALINEFSDTGYINVTITTNKMDPQDKFTFIMDFNVPINKPTQSTSSTTFNGSIAKPSSVPQGETLSAVANGGSITTFPNPNNYIITLNRSLTNVKAIRIVSSEIPNTDRIININNNTFSFDVRTGGDKSTNESFDFAIDPGNYTVQELAQEIQLKANMEAFSIDPNLFTVSVDETKGIFKIETNDPYTFLFDFNDKPELGRRNVYKMLGFQYPTPVDPKIDPGADDGFVNEFSNLILINQGTATNPIETFVPFGAFNLRKSTIVWLYLNGYETIYDTLTQRDYFTKFTFNNVEDNELAFDTFNSSPTVFVDAPIPSLSELAISFFDESGSPYNFNNVDHSFTLEFRHHMDRLMGVDYSSRRGINDKTTYV